jgi:hypothetical protein
MPKGDVILAVYEDNREITVDIVNEWITDENVSELSDFIYNRLVGRYLKPFSYPSNDYKKNYKDGFSIMANSCLLIETFVSFKAPNLRNTYGKSERCFGYFFVTETNFSVFSLGALSLARYEDITVDIQKNEKTGLLHEFYSNVRCGILHNGETKGGWLIRREGILFDVNTKTINATDFAKQLYISIDRFRNQLKSSDFNDDLFQNYILRLKDLIAKT